MVIAMAAVGMGAAGIVFPAAVLRGGLEIAFARQHNLGCGEFRHRHRVGSRRAEHPHAAFKAGTRKELYASRTVKHCFQPRKIGCQLLRRERMHSPSGEQHLHLSAILAALFPRVLLV